MSKYVMSDLHGKYDEFIEMLNLIKFNSGDHLYILGDIIDRGDMAFNIIVYVMNQPNITVLRGNHEDMMLDYCLSHDREAYSLWMINGGRITFGQFNGFTEEYQAQIIEWMKSLPLYEIVDDQFFLVHAGYHKNYKDAYTNERIRQFMLWAREKFFGCTDLTDCPFTVIIGHTPTQYLGAKGKMYEYGKIIDIDGGLAMPDGNLICLRLDDMQVYYV